MSAPIVPPVDSEQQEGIDPPELVIAGEVCCYDCRHALSGHRANGCSWTLLGFCSCTVPYGRLS